MISLLSLPDADVLSDLNGTVYLSKPLTMEEGLVVFPVTTILLVVAMVPEMQFNGDGDIAVR